MKIPVLIMFIFCSVNQIFGQNEERVILHAKDSLEVTAYWWLPRENDFKNVFVLCHQAGWNHREYDEIKHQLLQMGFACLILDQRSGGVFKNKPNETHNKALRKGKSTRYLDAIPDIEAAIEFAFKKNNNRPIILWGSSYSASLALIIGCQNEKVMGVIAFSPGEYFGQDFNVKKHIHNCEKPVFITGSRDEEQAVLDFKQVLPKAVFFIPIKDGRHGSSALWKSTPGHEEYWEKLMEFLKDNIH